MIADAEPVQRNEEGYRIGDSHHRCTVPDAVVVRMRDMFEHPEKPIGPTRIARLLGYPVSTVKKIVYYQRRVQRPPVSP